MGEVGGAEVGEVASVSPTDGVLVGVMLFSFGVSGDCFSKVGGNLKGFSIFLVFIVEFSFRTI